MKLLKKVFSVALALCMLMAMGTVAFAAGENEIHANNGTGTTVVELTAAASTFSVTVPTTLPIDVRADGTVSVASENPEIINNSLGPIKVTNVAVTAATGWTLIDYTANLKNEPVDAKKIALKINDVGAATGTTGNTIAPTFAVINGGASQSFTYGANIPARSTAIAEGTPVASVVFTVAWSTATP